MAHSNTHEHEREEKRERKEKGGGGEREEEKGRERRNRRKMEREKEKEREGDMKKRGERRKCEGTERERRMEREGERREARVNLAGNYLNLCITLSALSEHHYVLSSFLVNHRYHYESLASSASHSLSYPTLPYVCLYSVAFVFTDQ